MTYKYFEGFFRLKTEAEMQEYWDKYKQELWDENLRATLSSIQLDL